MALNEAAQPDAHLLVVDDRPDDVRLLVELLRAARFRISIALNGSQAYTRAVAGSPDLILMDVRMPRMDGFAACRLLKSDPATAAIPIIFLTASGNLDERLQGLQNGGVDYVVKPFAPAEVLARVRIHLARSAGAPDAATAAASPRARLNTDQVLVNAAIRVLNNQLSANHTLEQLARMVGTNEKRLSRAFKEQLGKTVFEFLREERLRVAERLLADTSLRISDVAEEVGFSSSANFATAFREHCGITPTAYRERARATAEREDDGPLSATHPEPL